MAGENRSQDDAPFPVHPDDFRHDRRIHFDSASNTHMLKDSRGDEWEWSTESRQWLSTQQQGRVGPCFEHGWCEHKNFLTGEMEDGAAAGDAPTEGETIDYRKRRADAREQAQEAKKRRMEMNATQVRAIYVTSLPKDTDEDEVYEVFSRFGVIAESAETNDPRISLYRNDDGTLKGDALIVYFRHESVGLAIQMQDETDFRPGQPQPTGPMRVKEADYTYKAQKENEQPGEEAKRKPKTKREREMQARKTKEMIARLSDWPDDDPDGDRTEKSSRWDKVMVLKHMFSLKELEEDPYAVEDITEDVREEAAKYGDVNKVIVFDDEPSGVVTVRFESEDAASACAAAFDGRKFGERKVKAYIADGTEHFRKAKEAEAKGEDERIDAFGNWLEGNAQPAQATGQAAGNGS